MKKKLNNCWPKHAGYSSGRDFRTAKRRDVRLALKAVDALRLGCAFTPAMREILAATEHLETAQTLLSVKQWKR